MKALKENLNILVVMSLINSLVLWNYISKGKTMHGIGYFLFFYLAIFTIHFFTEKLPPKVDFDVKEPKKEFLLVMLFSALGAVFITVNFYIQSNFEQLGFLVRLPVLLGMLFFTFPLGIAIYLLIKKYKLPQLGFRFKPISYFVLAIIVWGLTGIFAYLFNKSGIIWKEGYEELGGVPGLLSGIISAGLVEEFSRFAMQSRFEKVFKSSGFGILFATIIWSFMHFPTNYFKGYELNGIFIYCLQIIPLGFVWGYLTYRTKSLLPSTLIHGLNLWGFQNG